MAKYVWEVIYWAILVLAVAAILAFAYEYAGASECWSSPHSNTDKYTRHMPQHEGKLCWHSTYPDKKITYQRASYGPGGAFYRPFYKQLIPLPRFFADQPAVSNYLHPDTLKAIDDFLLLNGLQKDQQLKDYFINKMLEIQKQRIKP